MKKVIILAALWASAVPAAAQSVDLTGMSCSRQTNWGTQTWEFYDEVAIQYYDDGSVWSLPRVGESAYEKYDSNGEWTAVYYFFETNDEVQLRILSRPGLMTREENRSAPLEKGVFPFNASCAPIWQQP